LLANDHDHAVTACSDTDNSWPCRRHERTSSHPKCKEQPICPKSDLHVRQYHTAKAYNLALYCVALRHHHVLLWLDLWLVSRIDLSTLAAEIQLIFQMWIAPNHLRRMALLHRRWECLDETFARGSESAVTEDDEAWCVTMNVTASEPEPDTECEWQWLRSSR